MSTNLRLPLIISEITASLIGQAAIIVKMYVRTFKLMLLFLTVTSELFEVTLADNITREIKGKMSKLPIISQMFNLQRHKKHNVNVCVEKLIYNRLVGLWCLMQL